ncbi:LysM peptidoglycan-binding domain-containing protein [Flindersiella endophytica]
MTATPLDAIPAPSPYPRTSRYYATPTAVHTTPDGRRQIPYLTRRFLPQPATLVQIDEHVVSEGDRLDLIANRFLGDPGAWWQVADANPSLDPRELTQTPGTKLRITMPQGIPANAGTVNGPNG